jgi:DNA-binding MarR family transcriptional regulator
VARPAVTQLIARRQDAGLVRREADPADGGVGELDETLVAALRNNGRA